MILTEPTPEFLEGGRRLHLYLWKWGKVRFIRQPSGAGIYSYVPTETPLAVVTPAGERFRLTLPPCRAAIPYFVALRGFQAVAPVDLRSSIRRSGAILEACRALSVADLRARFGRVPVAPEDAYASGQCWFGSKAWAEKYFGEVAPPIDLLLSALGRIPPVEVSAFVSAAIYAAAYVIGDDPALLAGVGPEEIARAVAEGRKADGSGVGRFARMNADIHGRRRDGKAIQPQAAERKPA